MDRSIVLLYYCLYISKIEKQLIIIIIITTIIIIIMALKIMRLITLVSNAPIFVIFERLLFTKLFLKRF